MDKHPTLESLKDLAQLSASFTEIEKNFKELRANAPANVTKDEHYHAVNNLYDSMHRMISNVHDRIDRIGNSLYQHAENGHLPPIKTASQMQGALNALGMAGDYNVAKPTLYCNASKDKGIVEIEYKKKI